MSTEHITTFEQVSAFLAGTQAVAFEVAADKPARYQWMQKTLVRFRYYQLGKAEKGLITRYLMKVTGYSHAQTKRLIQRYQKTGKIAAKPTPRNGFPSRYRPNDIRLLAEMDERHQQPSGAVLKKLCERAYQQFGQTEYQRLAQISVSLYTTCASQRPISVSAGRSTKRARSGHRLAFDANLAPIISPVIFASTQSIRVIRVNAKASITLMPLIRSRSLKSLSPLSASASASCCLPWSNY